MADIERHRPDEAGQLWTGSAWGAYGMPHYAVALLQGLLDEVKVVFWNVNQRTWGDDLLGIGHNDPGIPGLTFRPFRYPAEDGDGTIAADDPAHQPNLVIGDVEVRWYKHPGRGTSVNREMTAQDWADWYERGYALIHDYGRAHDGLRARCDCHPR